MHKFFHDTWYKNEKDNKFYNYRSNICALCNQDVEIVDVWNKTVGKHKQKKNKRENQKKVYMFSSKGDETKEINKSELDPEV